MDGVFTEKEQIHRIDNQGDKITTSKHKTTYIWKSSTLLYFTRGFLLSEATFQILSLWGMRNKTVSGRGHAAAAQMINCADCSFFKSLIMLRQHKRDINPLWSLWDENIHLCSHLDVQIYTELIFNQSQACQIASKNISVFRGFIHPTSICVFV